MTQTTYLYAADCTGHEQVYNETPLTHYLACLKAYPCGTISRQHLAGASRAYYNACKRGILHTRKRPKALANILRYHMLMERYKHNRAANLYATQDADDTAYQRIQRLHLHLINEVHIAREQRTTNAYTKRQNSTVLAKHPITHLTHRVLYTTAQLWQEEHNTDEHECPN